MQRLTIYLFALIGLMASLDYGIDWLSNLNLWKTKTIIYQIAETAEAKETSWSLPNFPKEDQPELIADKIYQLESSSGKNDDKCERIGKHNGYGYMQGVERNFCLDSDDEVRKLVIDWIKDHQKEGLSTGELLCHYNTGEITENCTYYENYKQID